MIWAGQLAELAEFDHGAPALLVSLRSLQEEGSMFVHVAEAKG